MTNTNKFNPDLTIAIAHSMASAVANRREFNVTHEGHTFSIWYDQGAIPVITVTSPTGAVLIEELASDKPEILMQALLPLVLQAKA